MKVGNWTIDGDTSGIASAVEDKQSNKITIVLNENNSSARQYTVKYEEGNKCGKTTITQAGSQPTPPIPGNRVRLKTLTINNNTGDKLYILEYFRIRIKGCDYPPGCILHIYTQYAKNNTSWYGEWKEDPETGKRECDMSAGNTTSNVALKPGRTVYHNIECAADYPVSSVYEGEEACENSGKYYEYSDPSSITGKTMTEAYVMTVYKDDSSWYKEGLICSAEPDVAFNADGNDNLTITINRICTEGSDYGCALPAHHKNPAGSEDVDPHVTEN